jgi:SNF2 family DNA or RNA helicase
MVLIDGRLRFTLRAKTAHILYPHQRAGIEWFWSLHTEGMGGILGDDMGLGKTMQVCLKLFDYMEIGLLSEIT